MDMEGCRLHGRVEAQRVRRTLRISTGPESYGLLREVFKIRGTSTRDTR